MTHRPWPQPKRPDKTAPPVVTGSYATIDVAPLPGLPPAKNLKSWDNWRAFVHQITPVIVTTLVGVGIVTNSQAALWVPLAFAILDPLLSVGNTTDKLRRIVYGLAGLLQVGGLATGLVVGLGTGGNGLIAASVGAGVTILSTFLARFYTPTTTMVPA